MTFCQLELLFIPILLSYFTQWRKWLQHDGATPHYARVIGLPRFGYSRWMDGSVWTHQMTRHDSTWFSSVVLSKVQNVYETLSSRKWQLKHLLKQWFFLMNIQVSSGGLPSVRGGLPVKYHRQIHEGWRKKQKSMFHHLNLAIRRLQLSTHPLFFFSIFFL